MKIHDVSTSYDDGPELVVRNLPDGDVTLSLTFVDAPMGAGGEISRTRVTFVAVVHYEWREGGSDFGPHLPPAGNPDDLEFGLIRIEDSELRDTLLRPSPGLGMAPESALGVEHYRIHFDNHGTYDVLCRGITIEAA